VSTRVKDIYRNDELIKGRADWALGYRAIKSDTSVILLVVVGANPFEAAIVGALANGLYDGSERCT
jgi:hypothetical protein